MNLPIIIYLISLFDSLNWLAIIIGVLMIPAGLIMAGMFDSSPKDEHESLSKFWTGWWKLHGAVLAVVAFTAFIVPDKETSYAMLAAYGVESVAQTEEAQRLAGKSLRVLESYMDQYLPEEED